MDLLIDRIASPIGTILLVSDGEAVRALDFDDYEDRLAVLLRRHYGTYSLTPATDPGGVRAPLRDYFAGNYAALDRVPVRTAGTPFQRSVWAALRTIPARSAISYGQLAIRLGTPKASRAVGLANGANPVAIIVPCHRVIGADGGLTGYGGGLPRKRWLLDHEGATFRA
jgi:methylated-DNA-[protein]-cysteine S-methyltransferase